MQCSFSIKRPLLAFARAITGTITWLPASVEDIPGVVVEVFVVVLIEIGPECPELLYSLVGAPVGKRRRKSEDDVGSEKLDELRVVVGFEPCERETAGFNYFDVANASALARPARSPRLPLTRSSNR